MEEILLSFAVTALGALVIALGGMWTAVARIDRKLNLILQHLNVDPSQRLRMSERVKQLARDPAAKIEAIKVYREETGAGLADAKEAVEAYIDSQQTKG
jgi:ribosomal protein L7/L12